jgi:hypothetical protein
MKCDFFDAEVHTNARTTGKCKTVVDEETSDEDDAYARAPADSGSSTRLLSVQVMRVLWVLYPRIIGD